MSTIPQYPALLIVVKSLGLLSMIASSLIIRHILKRLIGKRGNNDSASAGIWSSIRSFQVIASEITLTQSIMLCLSCGDLISSFFVPFLSTWMVPKVRQYLDSCCAAGAVLMHLQRYCDVSFQFYCINNII